MCLIIFAHRPDADLPLVVTANRDEFFSRPTREAGFWDDENLPGILAGRDLQAGGTWLGVTRSGRFAAVTNIRDPARQQPKPRSRGDLTRNFLASSDSAEDYCRSLQPSFDDFAGFNLLVSDGRSLCYVNNHAQIIETLEPGLYGLSNGRLNSDWPKVRRGREQLGALLDEPAALSTDSLLAMMTDRRLAVDAELPQTGVPKALERTLSAAFIHYPQESYGTRCSSALIVDRQGRMRFSEQNFDSEGTATSAHFYESQLEAVEAA